MTKGIRAARKEARPREILEAAFEEFAIRGYAATNVEHIAARAGVTKGTIYVYFENKEDVFEKMVAELAQPILDETSYTEELGKTKSIDLLTEILSKIHASLMDHHYNRQILRFLVAEAGSFADLHQKNRDSYVLPVLSAVQAILRYGCESGEFRQEAADIDSMVFISPILGLNVMTHLDPELTSQSRRFMEQHLSIIRYFLVGSFIARAGTDLNENPDTADR